MLQLSNVPFPAQGFIDPILIQNMSEMISNNTSLRARYMDNMFDRRRDIDKECGFPDQTEITAEKLDELYNSDAIAARVVELYPKECFKVSPEIIETEDEAISTPFEVSLEELGRQLQPEPGYYKTEECNNPLTDYMLRADIVSGIGRYGVVVFDIDDGLPMSEPAIFNPSDVSTRKLKGIYVLPERLAYITAVDTDKNSLRYGHPLAYQITFFNPHDISNTGIGVGKLTERVHWTRVVHIVDNVTSGSQILGKPRCHQVLKNILTLQKLYYGSGEMYWLAAFPGISFESHPQLGGDVTYNKTRMKDMMENYYNGLQRYLLSVGMSAKMLAPSVKDPSPQIDKQLEAICIKLAVPVPVFKGYEVGENAGTMNTEDWDDRIKARENGHCTNNVCVPIINRLVNLGCLARPQQGFLCKWPDVSSISQKEKVDNNSKNVASFVAYIGSEMRNQVSVLDYLTKYEGRTQDEAEAIIANSPATQMAQETQEQTEDVEISTQVDDTIDTVEEQDEETQSLPAPIPESDDMLL